MCMCVLHAYVNVYACCRCVCVYIHAVLSKGDTYMHIHMFMFIYLWACMLHAGVYVCICVCVCVCVCVLNVHTHKVLPQAAFLSRSNEEKNSHGHCDVQPTWHSWVCPSVAACIAEPQSPATSEGRWHPLTPTAGKRMVNNFSGEARDKNGLKYLIFAAPWGYTQLSGFLSLAGSLTLFSCLSMKNLLQLNRITSRAINANAVSGQSHSNKCIFIWTVLLEKLNRSICSLSPPCPPAPDHPHSPHNGKERRAEQSGTFFKWIWSDLMIPLCIN